MHFTTSLYRSGQRHPAPVDGKAVRRQWRGRRLLQRDWQCWRASQKLFPKGILLLWLMCGAGYASADDRLDKQRGDREPPRRTVGDDIGSRGEKQHPLHHIGSLMDNVKVRLHRHDTSQETRALQQSVVDGLSRLIDAQSQSPSQKSTTTGQQQPPRSPSGKRPGAATGDGASQGVTGGTNSKDHLLQRVWGHLPDRVRQQMETPLHEKFLPQYDEVIQDYFRRLATEDAE